MGKKILATEKLTGEYEREKRERKQKYMNT
jgi:hypothetical protein